MSRGQTAHLYAEDLQYLRIPIPPLEIQQEIRKDFDRQRNEAYKLKI
jgi:restriction endonuclease S subunit